MRIAEALRFTRGAVAGAKSKVQEMTHFAIEDGTIRAFNGIVTISSPIEFDTNCNPKATPFIAAIKECSAEVMVLSLTKANRVRVAGDKFKVFVECFEGEVPHPQPEGQLVEIDGEAWVKAFDVLSKFMGNDASRIWTNGIMIKDKSAFATNNVCLAQYWLGTDIGIPINIPSHAVKEILRIKEPPTHVQVHENSLTFHYTEDRWLRTQLYETKWPDMSAILDVESNPVPVPEELYAALQAVRPFVDKAGLVYLNGSTVSTDTEEGVGASHEVTGLDGTGIYHVEMLRLLEDTATTADFSRYPEPTLFFGDNIRGAILGRRA